MDSISLRKHIFKDKRYSGPSLWIEDLHLHQIFLFAYIRILLTSKLKKIMDS